MRAWRAAGRSRRNKGAAGGLEVWFRDDVSIFDVLMGGH